MPWKIVAQAIKVGLILFREKNFKFFSLIFFSLQKIGILLLNLTNQFKDKHLESAYQRYSQRQRQKSLVIVNVIDIIIKIIFLLAYFLASNDFINNINFNNENDNTNYQNNNNNGDGLIMTNNVIVNNDNNFQIYQSINLSKTISSPLTQQQQNHHHNHHHRNHYHHQRHRNIRSNANTDESHPLSFSFGLNGNFLFVI